MGNRVNSASSGRWTVEFINGRGGVMEGKEGTRKEETAYNQSEEEEEYRTKRQSEYSDYRNL